MKELKENNNRVWFQEHKKDFEIIKKDFESFVTSLIANISFFEPDVALLQAKKCIYRINRDTRFSRDKSPYKINLWAYIDPFSSKTEIHSSAWYYVHIESGNSFIGWWAYLPESKWLYEIRKKIAENPKKFTDILEDKNFKKYFNFSWDKLKRPPTWFPKDHEAIELLKHKSFLADLSISNKEVLDGWFLDLTSKAFKQLKKFNGFLNEV